MNNAKEPTKFLWSRTYILKKKGKPVRFFNVKKRVGDMLFFELCEKDNRQQLVGRIFVPEGENREVCGFDWNDEFVFIVADYYISRGYKGRHLENHEPQILVGNEWVDHTKYREAIKRMDERFLNGLITDEE